jgi:NtrC-family two-component system sensor histidine kinase KinB
MKVRSLRARFILAGCVLVTATVACGAWGVFAFARLGAAVGETLRESERRIDLTAALASILERGDDALLLSLHGDVTVARRELNAERSRFEEGVHQLAGLPERPGREGGGRRPGPARRGLPPPRRSDAADGRSTRGPRRLCCA